MDKQQQSLSLLEHINNLPLHLLVSVLEYLDLETQIVVTQNCTFNQNSNQIFLKLVSLSVFASKYLRFTDRSVYMSFYSLPVFLRYQSNLLADICVRDSTKYFRMEANINKILSSMKEQLEGLQSRQQLVSLIENQIKDPQIPFPKMRKQGIAMHCNSSLQFAFVDQFFSSEQQDDFIEDSVMDLETYLQCIGNQMYEILSQKLSNKTKNKSTVTKIKQCYYHPQLLNSQNYKDYLIQQLTSYNIFVYLHALLSCIAELYHQYVLDQGKDFQRFVQFEMRYCLYRASVLNLQSSKISKIVYGAVEKILEMASKFEEEPQYTVKFQEEVIMEVSIKLQNKISGQYQQQGQELPLAHNISRISSQVKTQRSLQIYKNINIQMSGRLFITGSKIWTNQCRRVKQLNQQNPSPSKYISSASQQTINNKNYIKLLNGLLHSNILSRLQTDIEELNIISNNQRQTHSPMPILRDQDIVNIFGNLSIGEQYGDSNGSDQALSPTFSHHSYLSSAPLSPTSPCYSNFNDLIKRSAKHFDFNSTYSNALKSVQNKLRTQPYRFQKGHQIINQTFSTSPDKQKQRVFMQQINLQSLNKIPSLRQKKLLSKASMLSKFTKMTDNKIVGSIQQLFQSDNSLQSQALIQYHSYLIDLSVNQQTVHWCGHSQQYLMGDHYSNFQEYSIKFVEGFMYYLLKIVDETLIDIQRQIIKYHICNNNKPEFLSYKVLKRLFEMTLEYLDTGLMSRRTLRKLAKSGQQILNVFLKKYNRSQSQHQKLCFSDHLDQIDKMIDHYNSQMWHINKNVSEQKLKIYEQRKCPRNIIQMLRCQNNENQKQKGMQKKPQRKRRNSQQVLVAYNME